MSTGIRHCLSFCGGRPGLWESIIAQLLWWLAWSTGIRHCLSFCGGRPGLLEYVTVLGCVVGGLPGLQKHTTS